MYNIEMKKEIIFGNTEIEKLKFHNLKYPALVDDEDTDMVLICNKRSCKKSHKYFIDYKDEKKVKPLCIILPNWVNTQEVLMKLNFCLC